MTSSLLTEMTEAAEQAQDLTLHAAAREQPPAFVADLGHVIDALGGRT